MTNRLRVDVEPLSEQRWSKIEDGLAARLELEERRSQVRRAERAFGPVRRAWLAAAFVAAGLALALVLLPWRSEPAAIDAPSRISTGMSASRLALPGLTLDVEPESAVVVSAESAQGLLLVLDRGSIVCQVAPRPSDAPVVVQAGTARVRVLGTRFRVTRLGEGAEVEVSQGAVEVTSGGRLFQVGAGERWASQEATAQASDPTPSSADDAVEPEASEEHQSEGDRAVVDAPPEERATPRAASPRKSARAASAPPSMAPVRAESSPAGEEAAPGEPPVEPEPPKRSAQAVFEQATALERSDPKRAAELYRSLEAGGGSWAQNALYARGRLAASRGNRSEARRLLERYLAQYPNGSNAEDARAVLQRIR